MALTAALSLRAAGASLHAIAEQLGVSEPSVAAMIERAMKNHADPNDVRSARKLELARLDLLQMPLWARFQLSKGYDDDALMSLIRIILMRAKIMGLITKQVHATHEFVNREDLVTEIEAFLAGES